MMFQLGELEPADTPAVNRIALAAFEQYRHDFDDWDALSRAIGNMAALSPPARILVAKVDGRAVGAVAYVGPGVKKATFFAAQWAVMRMLVVDPKFRGLGIGAALARACIRRAVADDAPAIALHTSPIMGVALRMYERMGFRFEREAPALFGVPYGVYVLELGGARQRAGTP